MKSLARIVVVTALLALPSLVPAATVTTVFDNGAAGTGNVDSWSADGNWTNTSPLTITTAGNSVIVQIGAQPANNLIGIDTGLMSNTILSLTFNAPSSTGTITGDVNIRPQGIETLTVAGAITNQTAHNMSFSLPVLSGASATYTGGPTGGSLSFNTSFDVQSTTVTMINNVNIPGNLVGTSSGTLVTGDGTTASKVILSGANNTFFSGSLVINPQGNLQLGTGGTTGDTGSSTTAIVDNGTLTIDRSDALTGALAISGTGNLAQIGSGKYTLTAANTFSGTTSVTSGTLQLGNQLALQNSTLATGGTGIVFDSSVGTHAFTLGGLSGSTNLALTDNGAHAVALTVGKNNTSTSYSGALTGAGSLLKLGTGTLALAGANTYTGGTTISAGQLAVNGSTAAGTVAVGTAGTLAGFGTIGTAGDTDIVTGNGTIDLTAPGKIAGTLNVTGGNWTGAGSVGVATNVNSGLFTIGSGANLTTPTLNVNSGSIVAADSTSTITGSVNYVSATSSTYQGVIAGAGKTVTLNNSAASWTLSGANTYTGATTVDAGTLIVTGTTTSATTVGNNTALATLSGTGRINGAVILSSTVSHAAHLSPGANASAGSVGTLHVGSLTIGTGSMLDFDLSSTAAGSNDAIAMTGTLSFGGLSTINFNELNGTLQTGVAYNLISGGTASIGSATFNATGLTDLTAAFTSVANGLQVIFSPTGGNTSYYYTGTGTSTGVFGEADNYNTLPSGGAVQTIAPGSTSNIFIAASPAPSSVAVSLGNSSITINSLTFTTTGSGAVLSSTGGVLTVQSGITVQPGVGGSEAITAPIVLGATQVWTVNSGGTLLDSGGISGAFSLTKAGTGALVILGGTNYTGTTTINAGVLNLQSSGAINGTAGVMVANGAALQLQNGITTAAKPLSLTGTGVGNGALENVSGDNTYAGLVTLAGATTIGSDAGSITLSNTGTITGAFGLTLAGAGNGVVASVIGTGTSTLNKTGAGMWTLAGANTFTGLTTISDGTLALAAGGRLAQSSGINLSSSSATFDPSAGNQTIKDLTGVAGSNVNLGASTLTLGTANSTTMAGNIAGTGGSIVKNGSGTLTLSGTNTYDGGTTINAGAASVQSVAGNLGSGNVTLGGGKLLTTTSSTATNLVALSTGTSTLAAASGTTGIYAGAIGGSGSVVIGDGTNAGTIVLAANNNYAGTTTITAGTTAGIGAGGAAGTAGSGAIADNGVAVFNRTDSATIGNTITGTGRVVQAGTGTLALTATNNTYSGGTTIMHGVLSVGAIDPTLGTGSITLSGGELATTGASSSTGKSITLGAGTNTLAAATTAIYSGVISGANALTIGDGTNAGTVAFTGNNTYTGVTTIANGTLQLGSGATGGSVAGNIANNSALIFDHSGTFTYGGVISGGGTVNSVQGTLNLTGVNTYSGATSITAGSLQLSGSGSIANSAVTLAGGTTLASIGTVNGVGALTLSGGTVNLKNNAINTLNTASLAGTGILSIDIGGVSNTSDLINVSGASSLGANAIVVNINSFGAASLGTTYTFLTDTSGVLSAGDFTLGSLTGTLLSPDDVTFGISGDGKSAFFQVTGPAGNAYYYTGTGTNTTAFGEADNYNTQASGGAVQTLAPGAASNIFIGTTSPTPANLTPTLGNSNLTINTLNFTTTGAGATLSSTGGVLTIKAGVTEQTGVVTISAPVALGNSQAWTINSGATLIDGGGISGGFGLTKSGSGALVLTGVNTYTGATAINSGLVNLQNGGALNGTSGVTVASGAALQLQGGITTAAAPLSLSGVGGGNGALENVTGGNTYAGLITLTAATTIGSDAGTMTLSNTGTITGNGSALTLAGAGSGVVASAIGTGAGTLSKTGSGTWTLNGVNSFTGETTISAGTLALGTTGSLAQSSGVNLSAGAATLDISSGSHTIKDLTGASGSNVNLGGSALTLGTANSTTFAGDITGSGGSIVKNGAGTLGLTGTNTYSGGTTINAGTVKVASIDTNLGSGNLAFGGGELLTTASTTTAKGATFAAGTSTIATANGTTTTYNGTFGGAGALKLGDAANGGILVLNGANSFTGATIAAGTVVAGNTSALGTGNVTMSAGTLGLGNGANEIDVAGNYTQTGGTLVLSLSGTTAGAAPGYQFLNVTGSAALGGTLVVNVSNLYVPVSTDTFTFVQAQGGITGGFASATSNLAALQITPQGGGFIISQSGFVTLPVSYSPNALAIAGAIDAGMLNPNPTPAFQSLVTALDSLTTSTTLYLLPDAVDQLSPAKFENFARTDVINNVSFMTGGFDNYTATQRSLDGGFIGSTGQIDSSNLTVMNPSMDPNLAGISSRLLAWNPSAIGHGLLSDVPNPVLGGVELREDKKEMKASAPEGNPFSSFIMGSVVLAQDFSQPGVPHADTTTGAVQIGGDYRITPHLRAGVMFGYGHTDADTDENGSKATTDSYAPGIYITYAQGGWYANMLASYGFDSFTSDRHISFANLSGVAHGAPTGDQVVANLDGGYDFHHKNWTFGPTLGVQYTHLDVNGFSEDGIDQADLTVGRQETDSLRSRLGAHVSYLIQTGKVTLTPHLDASWQHEFMDQGRGITSQFNNGAGPFSIQTPDPSRESALIDAGLSADLGQLTFFGDYAVQAGQDNYFGQSVQAGVKLGF